jgi:hypothetical protein
MMNGNNDKDNNVNGMPLLSWDGRTNKGYPTKTAVAANFSFLSTAHNSKNVATD